MKIKNVCNKGQDWVKRNEDEIENVVAIGFASLMCIGMGYKLSDYHHKKVLDDVMTNCIDNGNVSWIPRSSNTNDGILILSIETLQKLKK